MIPKSADTTLGTLIIYSVNFNKLSARWRKDWVKASSELAQDRRAWSAFVRDVVNVIGNAGSAHPKWMSPPVQVRDWLSVIPVIRN